MRIREILLTLAALSLLAVGCGGDDPKPSAERQPPSTRVTDRGMEPPDTDTVHTSEKRRDRSDGHGSDAPAPQSPPRERPSSGAAKTAQQEGPASGRTARPKKAEEGPGTATREQPPEKDEH
jgi:hypothetical protein